MSVYARLRACVHVCVWLPGMYHVYDQIHENTETLILVSAIKI